MKIILSGGGTLGPVTPLIAIYQAYKKRHPFCEFVWVGTRRGVEKELLKNSGMKYVALPAGKFRRYLSFWNLIDIFRVIAAFFIACHFLKKEKPNLCISAGGFVSVPVHWAAAWLKIPTWVHQQDVCPGLANKIMARTATRVTVATSFGMKALHRQKTFLLGNPARHLELTDRHRARKNFLLPENAPVVFVTGGGTGAARLNDLIISALPHLPDDCHVIHLIGRERSAEKEATEAAKNNHYRFYKFFTDEMAEAYAAADLVICRGGFGTLTELASLKKPAMVMPISKSQQVANVEPLAQVGAVEMIDEKNITGQELAARAIALMNNSKRRAEMGEKLSRLLPIASDEIIVETVEELAKI